MTYCTPVETRVARKSHVCTWCSEPIRPGDTYKRWASMEDSCFTNKIHMECLDPLQQECRESWEGEYIPYEGERPKL
jgi:hypothetical protein